MTDRFSHPLSIQPTATQRSRQSPNRASISSRASGSRNPSETGRQRGSRSEPPVVTTSNPSDQMQDDVNRDRLPQNRSRASTTARSRIPLALSGIGFEELDIYLVRWDLLDDDELARACGTFTSSSSPSPFHRTRPLPIDARAGHSPRFPSDVVPDSPRLSRSSSSISSLTTPKTRPRPLKRFSTQILALTVPQLESQGPEQSTSRHRSEGIFPPSPPATLPEFGRRGDDRVSADEADAGVEHTSPPRPVQPHLHPLRVLSRLSRELGETCLKLEEENQALRSSLAGQTKLGQDDVQPDGTSGAQTVTGSGGIVTPRRGSTGQRTTAERSDIEARREAEDKRLSSLFREEDQVRSCSDYG